MKPPTANASRSGYTGIRLIAAFKLLKGLMLVAVGIGALKLLHHDVAEMVAHFINVLRVDPDNRLINKLIVTLLSVDDRRLKEISAGTFFYAALLLTEGTGLALRKRWAEYFTIVATGSLIPLEVFELIRHFTLTKIVVIAVNVAIVGYLAARVMRDASSKSQSNAQGG
jgi:uncharacterized membrane protein (DUF2068 family)